MIWWEMAFSSVLAENGLRKKCRFINGIIYQNYATLHLASLGASGTEERGGSFEKLHLTFYQRWENLGWAPCDQMFTRSALVPASFLTLLLRESSCNCDIYQAASIVQWNGHHHPWFLTLTIVTSLEMGPITQCQVLFNSVFCVDNIFEIAVSPHN